jgi:hypothetical protein
MSLALRAAEIALGGGFMIGMAGWRTRTPQLMGAVMIKGRVP